MTRVQICMNATTDNGKDLRALLAGEGVEAPAGIVVTDLTLDTRSVRPGAAFVALPGTRTHGVGFAAQAVAAGARAILWEPVQGVAAPRVPANVAAIAVPELTRRLGGVADRFFDSPSASVRVLGVTGTNGKTTTAYVIAEALERVGESSAYAGTLGHGRIGAVRAGSHTTPDCITVHRQIAELRAQGVRLLGMEVTSHALDQHRVAGVRFETAVFTNLTRDHLDYHGTFEAYGAAKAKLFAWPGLKHAVVNVQDPYGLELVLQTAAPRLTTYARASTDALADARLRGDRICATHVAAGPRGLDISLDGSYGPATLRSRFIGDFNVENALAVLAAVLGLGIPLADALAALEQCSAPPGRMETLSEPGKPLAIVDYAHTPDALEKALLAVRKHCEGRLFCVFGCGGDRDRGKRPLMGAIAERLADRLIVTDDNPRTENGDAIVADILSGLAAPRRASIERDRARAIRAAIAEAQSGDAVLIAGKGHEDYQIIGVERRAFSDRDVALAALKERP
jgi:UDP-N-acetylmuramoyl-L-alanyl-D-glutamate--2,6-diaminopimelate ligase